MYLKISNRLSSTTELVFAKNRLAPINEVTIPQLEIMGVVIGCRVSNFVESQLNVGDIKQKILTDSKCVLEWYRSTKEVKRFVLENIKEIRAYNVKLGYVKSEDNPTDIASIGTTVKKLINSKLWWKVPDWLNDINGIPASMYEINEEIRCDASNEEKGSKTRS